MNELCRETIASLAPRINAGEVRAREVVDACLARIDATDERLNSFITVLAEDARAAADAADTDVAAGRYRGPLHGIPVALKDLYYTKGVRTTAGSKILGDFVPDEDAHSVALLKAAGAVILGKTNLHEFASGATTMNPHYGATHNPYDLDRIPGGSSGGSGAATAAHQCIASTGSDTGGSIRNPACLNGIVGIKPTYGRVSRHGLVPMCWSLDHAGPLTKCVTDAAHMLHAMSGYDGKDPASARRPVPEFAQALTGDIRGLRIGVEREYFAALTDPAVLAQVDAAVEVLAGLGAIVTPITVPELEHAPGAEYVTMVSEVAAYHREWLATRPEDYGMDVRLLAQAGLAVQAIDYLKAQQMRRVVADGFAEAFERVDVIVGATQPIVAPEIGEMMVEAPDGTMQDVGIMLSMHMLPYNLTGLPAITVPCGAVDGLPVGLQIAGRWWDEATVLRVAHAYEQAAQISLPDLAV